MHLVILFESQLEVDTLCPKQLHLSAQTLSHFLFRLARHLMPYGRSPYLLFELAAFQRYIHL